MVQQSGSPREMYCLDCSYNLRGLAQPVCPECGRDFDPADEKSYSPEAFSPEARRLAHGARRFGNEVGDAAALGCLAPLALIVMGAIVGLAVSLLRWLKGS